MQYMPGYGSARTRLVDNGDGKYSLEIYFPFRPMQPRLTFPVDSSTAGALNSLLSDTERIAPRPLGLDKGTCFVCGAKSGTMNSFASFVDSKEAGQRIVEMFPEHKPSLDYRDDQPKWTQVKISACSRHAQALVGLRLKIIARDCTISAEFISEFLQPKSLELYL